MSRLFRINGLGGNCSHVIDSSTSYTYPFLPVGVSGSSLGLDGKVRLNSGIFKEHHCSAHWARSDQRHPSPGPMDQVVMAGERPGKKIRWSKQTKVTKAKQNGNWPRAERLAPGQEHIRKRRLQSLLDRFSALLRLDRPPKPSQIRRSRPGGGGRFAPPRHRHGEYRQKTRIPTAGRAWAATRSCSN